MRRSPFGRPGRRPAQSADGPHHKGEPLKSSTIAIHGENDRIIGLLCVNMYLNTPLSGLLSSLSPGCSGNITGGVPESFAQNTTELIRTALEEERQRVLNDSSILPSNKNKMIVEGLYERGIFRIKEAVITVADMMGISKNTIYMHIRNYKNKI